MSRSLQSLTVLAIILCSLVNSNEERLLRSQVWNKKYADPKTVENKPENINPLQCSPKMLQALSLQMPFNRCPLEDRPCVSHCIETACPVPTWLDSYYEAVIPKITPEGAQFVGISVGCNKGIDAVNTLRMGSNSPRFSKEDWTHVMFEKTDTYQARGACNQGATPSFPLNSSKERPAIMHCIEPVPTTVEHLISSAAALGYDKGPHQTLVISPFAISSENTEGLFFPSGQEGIETLSLSSCSNPNTREALGCKHVSVYSLDSYTEKYMSSELSDQKQHINILSIDAEGYDFDILQGAQKTLPRAEYLEFEHHALLPWRKQSLGDAVSMLDVMGFNCYWAGQGKLWRLNGENCFLDHYEAKCWSNVACANRNLAPELVDIMEDIFYSTLRASNFRLDVRVKRNGAIK